MPLKGSWGSMLSLFATILVGMLSPRATRMALTRASVPATRRHENVTSQTHILLEKFQNLARGKSCPADISVSLYIRLYPTPPLSTLHPPASSSNPELR